MDGDEQRDREPGPLELGPWRGRSAPGAEHRDPPAAGEYFAGDGELYCVEQVLDDQVLAEDCSSGELVCIWTRDLLKLQRVALGSRPG